MLAVGLWNTAFIMLRYASSSRAVKALTPFWPPFSSGKRPIYRLPWGNLGPDTSFNAGSLVRSQICSSGLPPPACPPFPCNNTERTQILVSGSQQRACCTVGQGGNEQRLSNDRESLKGETLANWKPVSVIVCWRGSAQPDSGPGSTAWAKTIAHETQGLSLQQHLLQLGPAPQIHIHKKHME